MEIALYYIFSDSCEFNNLTNHWMSLLCRISLVKNIYQAQKPTYKKRQFEHGNI